MQGILFATFPLSPSTLTLPTDPVLGVWLVWIAFYSCQVLRLLGGLGQWGPQQEIRGRGRGVQGIQGIHALASSLQSHLAGRHPTHNSLLPGAHNFSFPHPIGSGGNNSSTALAYTL